MFQIKIKHIIPFIILGLIIFFSSCFEEDEALPPYPNEITTIYDDIEFYQSYFNLESDQVVSINNIDEWELGFECGKSGWHIITNSGNYWRIYNTHESDFEKNYTVPDEKKWGYDTQKYFPDSTAVGNWVDTNSTPFLYTNHIYILGKLQNDNYTELKKILLFYVDSFQYQFKYSDLSTGLTDTVIINKSDSVNFVYYSFADRDQKNIEPTKDSYDIIFTPYYDLATQLGITIPYLVRGVFLNYGHTFAYCDTINSFEEIDLSKINPEKLTPKRDIIGYDWKDVTIDIEGNSGSYTIKENRTYIIKTPEENYFKLKFISYQLNGENGFPRFEYQSVP